MTKTKGERLDDFLEKAMSLMTPKNLGSYMLGSFISMPVTNGIATYKAMQKFGKSKTDSIMASAAATLIAGYIGLELSPKSDYVNSAEVISISGQEVLLQFEYKPTVFDFVFPLIPNPMEKTIDVEIESPSEPKKANMNFANSPYHSFFNADKPFMVYKI